MRERVDKNTHRTGASGIGLDKNDVRISALNIEIEAKNAATFNLTEDWAQVERQLTTGNIGVLALRHPKYPEFEKTLVVMDFGDWIDLLQGQKEEINIINNKDDSLKYAIIRAKEVINSLLKKLE